MFLFKLNGKRTLFDIGVLLSREKLDFGSGALGAVDISLKTLERQALFCRQTLRS